MNAIATRLGYVQEALDFTSNTVIPRVNTAIGTAVGSAFSAFDGQFPTARASAMQTIVGAFSRLSGAAYHYFPGATSTIAGLATREIYGVSAGVVVAAILVTTLLARDISKTNKSPLRVTVETAALIGLNALFFSQLRALSPLRVASGVVALSLGTKVFIGAHRSEKAYISMLLVALVASHYLKGLPLAFTLPATLLGSATIVVARAIVSDSDSEMVMLAKTISIFTLTPLLCHSVATLFGVSTTLLNTAFVFALSVLPTVATVASDSNNLLANFRVTGFLGCMHFSPYLMITAASFAKSYFGL